MTTYPRSAMVFAAGFGTRMGELTKTLPKPMLKIAGRPMIDHAVTLLRDAGVQNIVANTHYLHDHIVPHLMELDVKISHETGEILDTGGGLKAAQPLLGEGPVITMNPDAAWSGPNPVQVLLSNWTPNLDALLLVIPRERAVERKGPGDFALTSGQLQRRGDHVYTGLQIIHPRLVNIVPDHVFSLNHVWDGLIDRNALAGAVYPGTWCDIGHPDGLATAEKLMSGNHV